jgi:toxin-antitoxin system PIN domain toxin
VIAVDSNILVYAHRQDSKWHHPARDFVRQLAEGRNSWAIPWPCIHEFLGIVTHPRIYKPTSSVRQAISQVELWLESPALVVPGESEDHWPRLRALMEKSQAAGPIVHDARIVAICHSHGVTVLYTADRDFSRFPELKTRNPLSA